MPSNLPPSAHYSFSGDIFQAGVAVQEHTEQSGGTLLWIPDHRNIEGYERTSGLFPC